MVVKFLVFHLKQIPSLSQEFFYWLNVAHVAARLVSVLWNHLGNLNTYHQYAYSPNPCIPFSFAMSKDREVIMQSRSALYCCVRWLRTSEAELDNAHWTHGLTVAWPYMHFSFSVWEATTITIAMPRWCGPTGPKQLAVTWMGYLCFKGYSFFVKGAVLVTLRLLPKCAFCSFKIQFTVPFITFLYFNCTTKLATRL